MTRISLWFLFDSALINVFYFTFGTVDGLLFFCLQSLTIYHLSILLLIYWCHNSVNMAKINQTYVTLFQIQKQTAPNRYKWKVAWHHQTLQGKKSLILAKQNGSDCGLQWFYITCSCKNVTAKFTSKIKQSYLKRAVN